MNPSNLFQNLTNRGQTGDGGLGDALGQMAGNLPGGLLGGAAAGGLMALLVGNKKARKFAGKAATIGGAAVLGGLAFKAYQNWQAGNSASATSPVVTSGGQPPARQPSPASFHQAAAGTNASEFDWILIQVMIAAAKADDHLDSAEQRKIVEAANGMRLSPEAKGRLFELMTGNVNIGALLVDAESIEQRTEIYLAARLAIDPDHAAEHAFLRDLAASLALPAELTTQLDAQVAAL